MSDDKLLDDVITSDNEFRPVPVSTGIRFANYLIDLIVFFVVSAGIIFVLGDTFGFLSYIIYFAYYVILEGTTGKTIGKMVTGCKVVTEYGDQPDFGAAALRTLIRIVPFEWLSILFGTDGRMWHDKWAKTYVVKSSEY